MSHVALETHVGIMLNGCAGVGVYKQCTRLYQVPVWWVLLSQLRVHAFHPACRFLPPLLWYYLIQQCLCSDHPKMAKHGIKETVIYLTSFTEIILRQWVARWLSHTKLNYSRWNGVHSFIFRNNTATSISLNKDFLTIKIQRGNMIIKEQSSCYYNNHLIRWLH